MTSAQIKDAILKSTEIELLFDNPYEDPKKIRVCGPFSVENLSPHRVLSLAAAHNNGTVSESEVK